MSCATAEVLIWEAPDVIPVAATILLGEARVPNIVATDAAPTGDQLVEEPESVFLYKVPLDTLRYKEPIGAEVALLEGSTVPERICELPLISKIDLSSLAVVPAHNSGDPIICPFLSYRS